MFWEHYKPPKWTRPSQRRNKGCDFPFRWEGVRDGGAAGSTATSRVEKSKRILRSFWIRFLCLVVRFFLPPPPPTSLVSPPPQSFPSPEALSGWAIGSIPANWGQRRIKLRSYGLIYTSISVDRRGNRILSRLILLGFLCTANIVWSVILKSSQLLSAALRCDFGYSLPQRELMVSDSLLVRPFSFSFFFKPVKTILSLPLFVPPRPTNPSLYLITLL